MKIEEPKDRIIYKIIRHDEERYSICSSDRENPLGWTDIGKTGNKEECLAYINEISKDMKPLTVRIVGTQTGC